MVGHVWLPSPNIRLIASLLLSVSVRQLGNVVKSVALRWAPDMLQFANQRPGCHSKISDTTHMVNMVTDQAAPFEPITAGSA